MYLGQVVELASSKELFKNPVHPYTKALLSAIPVPSIKNKRERIILKGEITSPINPPAGCRFAKRCWMAQDRCFKETPELINIGNEHHVACHLVK
ncbi:MAG: ABC transporter ATP-binding protein, partial [Caloramator sp.]|nr:ABC transporter ATP-binding protein [Caloramator sp.]